MLERHAQFGGEMLTIRYHSHAVNCKMNARVFLPPGFEAASTASVACVVCLGGLTASEVNLSTKAVTLTFVVDAWSILSVEMYDGGTASIQTVCQIPDDGV